MRRFTLSLLFVAIAIALMCRSAFAITPKRENRYEEAVEQVEQERVLPHKFEIFYRYMPVAHADQQGGKVGLMEAGSEYDYEGKVFGELPITFSLNTGYTGINNSTAVSLPAKLTSTTAEIEITLPFFRADKTYFRFGITPSLYGDDWNYKPSNFRIPSRYYIINQPNSKFTWIFGVAYFPGYQTQVLPIIGFIYLPNDKLAFNIVPPRPTIVYSLNNKIALFGEAEIEGDEYRVDLQHMNSRTLEFTSNKVGAGVKYKFNKYIESSFSAGETFGRQLKYKDDVGKVDIKNSVYAEFRLTAKI